MQMNGYFCQMLHIYTQIMRVFVLSWTYSIYRDIGYFILCQRVKASFCVGLCMCLFLYILTIVYMTTTIDEWLIQQRWLSKVDQPNVILHISSWPHMEKKLQINNAIFSQSTRITLSVHLYLRLVWVAWLGNK